MDHQEYKDLLMDYLAGSLDKQQQDSMEAYIQQHPETRIELESLKNTWMKVNTPKIPEPSQEMDQRFYAFLEKEMEQKAKQKSSIWEKIHSYFFERKMSFSLGQLALGLGLLLLGGFLGARYSQPSPAIPTDSLAQTSMAETEDIRTQLVMLLIDQPSASKRLQAVHEANKLSSVTEKITMALLKTLNQDPNVNVRLAALESLTKYVDIPEVREGLASSISHQTSPLIQIALADLMVRLQEKGAIDAMKELLETPEINQTVKQKIEESILQI